MSMRAQEKHLALLFVESPEFPLYVRADIASRLLKS